MSISRKIRTRRKNKKGQDGWDGNLHGGELPLPPLSNQPSSSPSSELLPYKRPPHASPNSYSRSKKRLSQERPLNSNPALTPLDTTPVLSPGKLDKLENQTTHQSPLKKSNKKKAGELKPLKTHAYVLVNVGALEECPILAVADTFTPTKRCTSKKRDRTLSPSRKKRRSPKGRNGKVAGRTIRKAAALQQEQGQEERPLSPQELVIYHGEWRRNSSPRRHLDRARELDISLNGKISSPSAAAKSAHGDSLLQRLARAKAAIEQKMSMRRQTYSVRTEVQREMGRAMNALRGETVLPVASADQDQAQDLDHSQNRYLVCGLMRRLRVAQAGMEAKMRARVLQHQQHSKQLQQGGGVAGSAAGALRDRLQAAQAGLEEKMRQSRAARQCPSRNDPSDRFLSI